jgi:hypothetical protein
MVKKRKNKNAIKGIVKLLNSCNYINGFLRFLAVLIIYNYSFTGSCIYGFVIIRFDNLLTEIGLNNLPCEVLNPF